MSQRTKVIQLYKTLLYMGRDYPKGYDVFKRNLRKVFEKNKQERDPEKIDKMLAHVIVSSYYQQLSKIVA